MFYFKNRDTNEIKSYEVDNPDNLGAALRTEPWEQIEEPQDVALASLKKEREKVKQNKKEACGNNKTPVATNKQKMRPNTTAVKKRGKIRFHRIELPLQFEISVGQYLFVNL